MPSKTILIVDDDPFILDILSRHLKGKGYRVLSTTDPETAYVLAEKELPDLVISDIAMPSVDGFTLLKALRDHANTSRIPVVLLTASDKMADVEQGFASGAKAYLLKPIHWETAWPKLALLLESPK